MLERCPVCNGKGIVSNGFYTTTNDYWSTTTTAPETCRSCGGKGYISSYEERIPDPPYSYPTPESNYTLDYSTAKFKIGDEVIVTLSTLTTNESYHGIIVNAWQLAGKWCYLVQNTESGELRCVEEFNMKLYKTTVPVEDNESLTVNTDEQGTIYPTLGYLTDTVDYMLSTDYKKRFVAEYAQLRIRMEKLKCIIDRYNEGTLEFELSAPITVYENQYLAMEIYFNILKQRASAERIYFRPKEVDEDSNCTVS